MTAKWPLPFVLVLGMSATRAAGPTVTIDTASPAGKVSPLFYGLMTEEINHVYDGGLYAELVRNRAFLDDAASPAHWSLVQADGSAATMALDPKEPLNTIIATSLRLNVTQAATGHAAGIANEGIGAFRLNPTRATVHPSTPRPRRIHRTNRSLDPERRRPDDLRDEDRQRSDVGVEADN